MRENLFLSLRMYRVSTAEHEDVDTSISISKKSKSNIGRDRTIRTD